MVIVLVPPPSILNWHAITLLSPDNHFFDSKRHCFLLIVSNPFVFLLQAAPRRPSKPLVKLQLTRKRNLIFFNCAAWKILHKMNFRALSSRV